MDVVVITLHCSATFNGEAYDIKQIDADHKSRGWDKVGYHFVIQPDGEIQKGRETNEKGAHVERANVFNSGVGIGINLGICLIGTDRFTLTQFVVLRNLIIAMFREHGFMNLKLHNQFESAKAQGKTCPNIEIRDLVKWITDSAPQFLSKYLLRS